MDMGTPAADLSAKAFAIIHAVRDHSLTYLSAEALRDLFESVAVLEKRGAEGVLIEAGCALGGSAIVIASAKSKQRPFFIHDVFGMIPPPSEKDGADVHRRYEVIKSGRSTGIGGNKYYGYETELYQKVRSNFERHHLPIEQNGIHLIRGRFEDTLTVESSVALAHIDGDWYESVMTCLVRIVPHLTSGGVLVIDDYYDWSGCRRAVDEYFADKRDTYSFVRKTRLHIVCRKRSCNA